MRTNDCEHRHAQSFIKKMMARDDVKEIHGNIEYSVVDNVRRTFALRPGTHPQIQSGVPCAVA